MLRDVASFPEGLSGATWQKLRDSFALEAVALGKLDGRSFSEVEGHIAKAYEEGSDFYQTLVVGKLPPDDVQDTFKARLIYCAKI